MPSVRPGAQLQPALDGLESLPVDDGLMGALHPVPLTLRRVDDYLGLVADLPPPTLDHHAGVHLVGQDAPHRHLVPQAEVIFDGVVAGPAPLRLVAGGVGDAPLVQQVGDVLPPVALQRPLVDLPDHLRRFGVGDDVIFVRWVLAVAVDGETADVLALPPFQVKHHADVFRQVLQIPLVHQTVDLPGLLVALDLRVGVVCHRDEPDAPDREQAVDVFLYQLHIPGKAGLALAEDNLELSLLGGLDHAVEVGAAAVGPRPIFVAKNRVDVPPVVDGIAGQQRLLVLDALGFRLLLVLVLLAQSCIDRAKDLLLLLQGVTARYHDTSWAATRQKIILNAFADKTTKASFVEFFCEPCSNRSINQLFVCFGYRHVMLAQNQNRVFHQNRLQQDL